MTPLSDPRGEPEAPSANGSERVRSAVGVLALLALCAGWGGALSTSLPDLEMGAPPGEVGWHFASSAWGWLGGSVVYAALRAQGAPAFWARKISFCAGLPYSLLLWLVVPEPPWSRYPDIHANMLRFAGGTLNRPLWGGRRGGRQG